MTARRLFGPDVLGPEVASHCAVPTPLILEDRVRVFVSSRDNKGRSRAYAVDLDRDDLGSLIATSGPVLDLGQPGHFDEDGTMPSSAVRLPDGRIRLYYVGWNRASGSVSYRVSIGSAISDDGLYFRREFDGPLLDRSHDEPILATTPFVEPVLEGYEMTYCSGTRWINAGGNLEPCYRLARAESADGIVWRRTGSLTLPLESEAITRPIIVRVKGRRYLACSHRGSIGYRDDPQHGYKLAFLAEDGDGWSITDDNFRPLGDEAWCKVMRCYGYVVELGGSHVLLYNGDGFGASGVLAAPLAFGGGVL